jgi:hypothetical protein
MTWRDVILAAMQELGAIAPGEPLPAHEAEVAMVRVRSMIDLWQTERLTIYNLSRELFTFRANQQAYTIGPDLASDFVTTTGRPIWLQHAGVLWTNSGIATEIPVKVMTDDEWAQTRIKSVASTIPTHVYYNWSYPLGTLYYWPVPTDVSVRAVLYLPVPIDAVAATLDTVLILPPGYEEAIRYHLAIRLAPLYSRPVPPEVSALAMEAKALIKRANLQPDQMRCDPAITGDSPPWNIFTGGQG